jgi:hypothetical protein
MFLNRVVGFIFIGIAIAICMNVFLRYPSLAEEYQLHKSPHRWLNSFALEIVKAIVAFILLRTGIKWVKLKRK